MFPSRLVVAVLLLPVSLLTGSSSPATWSPATWLWPLPPPHSVARPFEAPPTPYAAGHRGIDLPARPGDAVFAPAAGVVSFSGMVAGRPVLSISHPGDLISTVEPVRADVAAGDRVAEGDRVAAGQQVGRVASGGHCADACIHFGVRLHGQYVSPMLMLGGVPRAVLLPLND